MEHYNCADLIVGFSMGGHTALELATTTDIFSKSTPFYPALYPDSAVHLPFGESFTNAIRVEGAWRESSLLHRLKDFRGRVALVIGQDDSVIPQDLPVAIERSFANTDQYSGLLVRDAGHLLLPDLLKSDREMDRFAQLLAWLLA